MKKRIVSVILLIAMIFACGNFYVYSISDMTISNTTYPSVLPQGNTFSIYGNIKSDSKISSVTCEVKNIAGQVQFSKTVAPDAMEYSIHIIDDYLTFSKLSNGNYTYTVMASDSKVTDKILLQKNFTVKTTSIAESVLKAVDWNVIDISTWNTVESWKTVAGDIDAAILRIGYRGTVNRVIREDDTFVSSYNSAKEYGIPVGGYFFSNALNTDEAIEEAGYVMSVLQKNNCRMDMPIYIDMETEAQVALSRSECTEIAIAFCDVLKDNGYYAGLYCNKSFAESEVYASQLFDYTLWIAHYAAMCGYTGNHGIWQYSDSKTYDGIIGAVDANYCYFDYPSYIKTNALNGYTKTAYTFEVKNGTEAIVDTKTGVISNIKPGMLTSDFEKNYLSYSGVTLSYSGLYGKNIATGTKVTATFGGVKVGEYSLSVKGDVDPNGEINSTDALNILLYNVGTKTLSNLQLLSADYNNDSEINSVDALQVLQYIVN